MKKIIYLIILLLFTVFIAKNCKSTSGNNNIVTDIDGNTYQTVVINNQIWMQENLRTTRYNDGTPIPNITNNTEWRHQDTPAYTIYDNDLENKAIYGVLYNWYAVGDRPGLCPKGWYVPSDSDWKILEQYLGMSIDDIKSTGIRGSKASGQLKKSETTKWDESNISATNKTEFTAIPSGRRDARGEFIGLSASFTTWTSTDKTKSSATYRHLPAANDGIGRNPEGDKKIGFAVRCIKK